MKTLIASAFVALAAALPATAQTADLSAAQQIAIDNHNASVDSRGDLITVQPDDTTTDLSSRGTLSRSQKIAIAIHNANADGQGDRIVLPNG